MRREFERNRLLYRFIEQDLKFESFGNLGLNYTLLPEQYHLNQNYMVYQTLRMLNLIRITILVKQRKIK